MATTVLVTEATRKKLASARDAFQAKSINETIERLMREATPTAQQLFADHRRPVEAACRKHGVSRLVAFGSRVRADRAPGSDLDLVAKLPSGSTLFDLMQLQDDLQAAFGCKVDLGSIPDPHSRLAKHIAEEGVVLVPQAR